MNVAPLALPILLAVSSCKSDTPTESPNPGSSMPANQLEGGQGALECADGGTLRGVAEDCPFIVGDCCYETQEEGCLAAGCGGSDRCVVAESDPAQPMCM